MFLLCSTNLFPLPSRLKGKCCILSDVYSYLPDAARQLDKLAHRYVHCVSGLKSMGHQLHPFVRASIASQRQSTVAFRHE
jgi:hypothetical protein